MMEHYDVPIQINCFSPDNFTFADLQWYDIFFPNNVFVPRMSIDDLMDAEVSQPKEPIRTVYVGRIPCAATPAEVEKVFSYYGKIFNVFVKPANYYKRFTFGFVTYFNPNHARNCLHNKHLLSVRGQRLFINPADDWHQPIVTEDGSLQFKPRVLSDLKESDDGSAEESVEEDESIFEDPGASTSTFDDSLINKLNDDCLLKIFDYIPFQNKHILSEVCKRWDALMSNYWHRIRSMDFISGQFSTINCTARNISRYLKLCPNTKSISIGSLSSSNAATACINAIAYNCPRIEEVSIISTMLIDRQLAVLAHYCRSLKSFTLIHCTCSRSGGIGDILKKCQMLESLKIVGQAKSTCVFWLQHVNHPNLRKLILNVDLINNDHLISALSRIRHSLLELSLDFHSGKARRSYYDLTECLPLTKLQKLALFGSFKIPKDLVSELTHLELESNSIFNDDNLKYIVETCPQLEYLILTESGDLNLTEAGLCEIAKLTKLKLLYLGKIFALSDAVVKTFAQNLKELQELSFYASEDITDSSCKRIVTDLPNLTKLDITYCQNISIETILAASAAADANPRKPTLTIYPMGSAIDVYNNCESPSPRVIICLDHTLCKSVQFLDQLSLYDDDLDASDLDFLYESDDDESEMDLWGLGLPGDGYVIVNHY